jgi:hypothetical protein
MDGGAKSRAGALDENDWSVWLSLCIIVGKIQIEGGTAHSTCSSSSSAGVAKN